ncbi:MAG: response regulator transcription factor [gamma proteobacterium symbiont of Taylorina sp.]|nr:response regulator transcription factor [gamma proteobacterium symbiont of Taylorina sp.]
MKVLIAEDDLYIREGLAELLKQEGYQTLLAENGRQALDIYKEQGCSLVLLDIMMPEMDGFSVCKAIRKQDDNIPIVFITAKAEEIDQVVGLELGADDYIMKPFGTREVVARIRAVTRRCLKQQRASSQDKLSEKVIMNDLELFPDELKAKRGEQIFELSLRDSKILSLLARNKGKIVDRDTLFNHCWGRDYFPNSRTLDQHISKLRKLIEVDHKHPDIIKTVHGVGYRFEG